MDADLSSHPRLRADLVLRQVGEEFLVYDALIDRTTLLDLSAASVLGLCDGTHDAREIAAEIAAAFGESAGAVEERVSATLDRFVDERLLVAPKRTP